MNGLKVDWECTKKHKNELILNNETWTQSLKQVFKVCCIECQENRNIELEIIGKNSAIEGEI